MALFRGCLKGWGGWPFSGERVGGGYPVFSQEKIFTDILGNLGHFVALKMLCGFEKSLKTAYCVRFKVL
jgi:hypothetical protein